MLLNLVMLRISPIKALGRMIQGLAALPNPTIVLNGMFLDPISEVNSRANCILNPVSALKPLLRVSFD